MSAKPDGRRKGARKKPGSRPLRKRARKQKPTRWMRAKKWILRLGKMMLALMLLGASTLVGVFWYYGRHLPSVASLRHYEPPQTTRVLDRSGTVLGESFTERRTVVPLEQVPRMLVLSVLAAEDADFYEHEGLDYAGILRALVRDVLAGRPAQGASTITQQVVKLLLLTPERSLARKVRELILARRLEQELSKEEILYLYLNHINFGHGRYGVQEASRYYFGKNVSELTLAEASLIAGVPQSPTRLSPRDHPEAARRRQRFVLSQLAAKRDPHWPDLSLAEIEQARNTEVPIASIVHTSHNAPEILTLARRTLRNLVGEEAFARGGYTVHTTIDLELQRSVRQSLRDGLETVDARHGHQGRLPVPAHQRPLPPIAHVREGRTYLAEVTGTQDADGIVELNVGGHPAIATMSDATRYNPHHLRASRFAPHGSRVRVSLQHRPGDGPLDVAFERGPQGAAIILEPRSRDVLALVGDYRTIAGFNRATQALRQPGSTFKPIVYGFGIHQRSMTAATIMLDAPAVYDDYRPHNYETWNYEGAIRLREALANSINVVAIRSIEQLGPEAVAGFAHELGITSDLEASLSLALGASEVRPIELVNVYATFAAGGRWAPYRLIQSIEGPDGKELTLPELEAPRDVLTPAEAYVITSLLASVVQTGTGRQARSLGYPAAGKTGTSNDARDAWFVGYTSNRVAGVWVGYDDHRPLGRHENGGHTALPIWIDIMRSALAGSSPVEFPVPDGLEFRSIDPETGLLAYDGMENAIQEVFLEGTAPIETARPPDVADPNEFLMEQLGGADPVASTDVPNPGTPPPDPQETSPSPTHAEEP